ncbi:hypothetical protein ACN2MM_06000 [Alkalilimnicola ehrlichii MLHE-1]|uniref:Uncharacterized protein n=1 Tax=Alkalilimnicola ehrlichii (strain ATCC BAA-1101 / DSM 17681 / MLHE-1) TaxID=187272 RepID=Q0A9R6_ALKEH|nr:hypothetical protein [Alkalilimnicola ehrlichii]ABI56421.1 hypothetical protein Mlg_1069 [Alkalilimnicola ehrlichii MLHE-1]
MQAANVKALKDPIVEEARELLAEVDFRLGSIPTTVRLRLYYEIHNHALGYEQSHFIQTPLQDEPAMVDLEDEKDPDAALEALVSDFIQRYREAEQAGHRPSAGWLMPNRDFC